MTNIDYVLCPRSMKLKSTEHIMSALICINTHIFLTYYTMGDVSNNEYLILYSLLRQLKIVRFKIRKI
jgi:hypothetical protein